MKKKRLTLRKKADKLWSKIIMKRNEGCCEVCGKEGTNPHHIIGKKNLTLRHDPRNGVLLCFTHHTGGKESAHNDPMWFMLWLGENRKEDFVYLLIKKQNLTTQIDYEEIIKKLEKFLKENIEKTS